MHKGEQACNLSSELNIIIIHANYKLMNNIIKSAYFKETKYFTIPTFMAIQFLKDFGHLTNMFL
jgi:hypothetical protein